MHGAASATPARATPRGVSWLTERRLLAAAVLAWLVVAIASLVFGPPLGHDECAFAVIARGDATWLYKSRGVVMIAEFGLLLGGSEAAIRLLMVPLGAGVVLGTYAVGRVTCDGRTGAWAAALVAGAHPMALRSAELLGDLPATAALLVAIALLAGELSREAGPRWRIVLVAPAFAAAFYFRYGSAPVVAIAGFAATAIWWRAIVRRPAPYVAMVALLVGLLVPHVLHSLDATGTWRGVLDISRTMPRRAYLGEGLLTYLTSNPFVYYGALVAPVALVGLATFWRYGKAGVFLGIVALGQLVALGINTHGQPRYVFLAAALFVVLGVATLARLARPRLALALVAVAWLGVAVASVPYNLHLSNLRAPIIEAARVVEADAAGRPCLAVAGIVPQLMWYARCDGMVTTYVGVVPWPPKQAYVVSLLGHPADPAPMQRPARPLPTRDPRVLVWALD
jgi:hypothetical protein